MILCTFDTPGEEALLIIRIWHTHTHTRQCGTFTPKISARHDDSWVSLVSINIISADAAATS